MKKNIQEFPTHIEDAIKKGAKIIVSEEKINLKKKNIIFIKNSNPRKLLSQFSYRNVKNNFYL